MCGDTEVRLFEQKNHNTLSLQGGYVCVCVCMCCGEMVTCYNALCKHTVHHELLPYSSDRVVTTPVP